jgi:hypothetical protein
MLLKVLVFAYAEKVYLSQRIAKALRENIYLKIKSEWGLVVLSTSFYPLKNDHIQAFLDVLKIMTADI